MQRDAWYALSVRFSFLLYSLSGILLADLPVSGKPLKPYLCRAIFLATT